MEQIFTASEINDALLNLVALIGQDDENSAAQLAILELMNEGVMHVISIDEGQFVWAHVEDKAPAE